jgi:hypothetical protein
VTYQKLLTKERHHTTTHQNQFTSSIEKWEKSQFIEADPLPTVVARSKSSSTIKIIKKSLTQQPYSGIILVRLPE